MGCTGSFLSHQVNSLTIVSGCSIEIESVMDRLLPHPANPEGPVETAMTYHLDIDEPFAHGIRRVTLEEIDCILKQLTGPNPDWPAAVHEARKSSKKIRAILRLARESLGRKLYQRENLFFRDAGRQLAPIRESAARVEAFDQLAIRFSLSLEDEIWHRLREHLIRSHLKITENMTQNHATVKTVASQIRAARQRVSRWPLSGEGCSTMAIGLRRVYRQGRLALWKATHEPAVETWHEFRKQVKYLWHQTRLLRDGWPGAMDELSNSLHTLSTLLGDDHDLAELGLFLEKQSGRRLQQISKRLLELVEIRRSELLQEALPLAQRIYTEKPQSFTCRILSYWRIARNRHRTRDV